MKTLSSQLCIIAFVLIAMPTLFTSCSSDDDSAPVSVDNFTVANIVGVWSEERGGIVGDESPSDRTYYFAFDANGNLKGSYRNNAYYGTYGLSGRNLWMVVLGEDTVRTIIDSISSTALVLRTQNSDYDDYTSCNLKRFSDVADFFQSIETLSDDSLREYIQGGPWLMFINAENNAHYYNTLTFAENGTFAKQTYFDGEDTVALGTYLVKNHRIYMYNTLGVTEPDIEVISPRQLDRNRKYIDAISPDGRERTILTRTEFD